MNTGEIIEELIYIKDHVPLTLRGIEAVEEACNRLDELPNMLTEISALGEQSEDKHLICDLLAITLQRTRNLIDLISLKFDPATEIVTARFTNGMVRRINVECDSGVAMIRDIIKQLFWK